MGEMGRCTDADTKLQKESGGASTCRTPLARGVAQARAPPRRAPF